MLNHNETGEAPQPVKEKIQPQESKRN